MSRTLSQILTDVNSYTDLDASVPTGDELTIRTNYANQAVLEAADTGVFSEFNVIYNVDLGSGAVATLPGNFRGLLTAPRQSVNGGFVDYPEVPPAERFSKTSTDKYCYITGNPASNYLVTFNNLTANATISLDYQRFPSGFATLTDICELPDDTYIVEKVKSYVLQARNNERFPQVEANAQLKLKNMIGRSSKTLGGGENRTPTATKRYRMGE